MLNYFNGKSELMKALDELEIVTRSIPKRIIMTTEYFEKMKDNSIVNFDWSKVDTFCGVPIVIDESVDGFKIEYERR